MPFEAKEKSASVSVSELKHKQNAEGNLLNGGGFLTDNYALLIKRSKIDCRDICGLMCEMIMPFIMVLMGCGFA